MICVAFFPNFAEIPLCTPLPAHSPYPLSLLTLPTHSPLSLSRFTQNYQETWSKTFVLMP